MKTRNLTLWAMLAVGLVCTLLLLGCRFHAEWNDRDVLAVMSDADLSTLVEASGVPAHVWRELLAPADGYITTPDDTSTLPLALIEGRDRINVLSPENFDPETYQGPMVKAFYLYSQQYGRLAHLNDARPIGDLLFRAVTDRGLRLLILTPLRDAEGRLVTDPAVYREMLEGLRARLESRGYTYGKAFSCMDFHTPLEVRLLIFPAGLVPLGLGCRLLCLAPSLRRQKERLFPVVLALYAAFSALLGDLVFPLLPLASAMVFTCCAGWFVAEYVKKPDEKPLWQTVLVFTAALTGWSLAGGLQVAALMSCDRYLLGASVFSGVKFSLLLPTTLACLLLTRKLYKPLLSSGRKGWLRLAAAGAALGAVLLALTARSGDVSGGISALETAFRNFLEHTLYVRPRTKELLFAVPCIPVFLWACRRKHAPLQLLCGAGACLECVSVINTFCHAVAPLLVSVMRTLLGVGLGLVPGILAVLALEGLHRLRTR